MAEDWEGVDEPPSRLRWAGLAVVAIVVVGLLVRPAPDEPPGGLLDVVDVEATEASETPDARPGADPGRPTPEVRSVHTPSPDDLVALPGHWVEGAGHPGPAQAWPAVAWDGATSLYLFGGQTWSADGDRSSFHDSAWRYDMHDDGWTALPPPPLAPRSGAAVVWTGEELVVWGGMGRTQVHADGAAFNPARGAWRRLADAPLSPRHGAAVAETGAGLLFAGGADHAGSLVDSAIYDPVTDRWTTAPDLPVVGPWGMFGASVTAGEEVVIWLYEQWGHNQVPPLRFVGGAWQPTVLPAGNSYGGGLWGLTDVPGHGVFGLHTNLNGGREATLLRLQSGTSTWEPVSETTLPDPPGVTAVAVQQRYYIAINGGGQVHAYDLHYDRWLDVHRVPRTNLHNMPVFPLDDGFLVLVTPPEPEGVTEVLRFVIGGEPLDPAEVEQTDPGPLITPRP